jgi:hypothetical protein
MICSTTTPALARQQKICQDLATSGGRHYEVAAGVTVLQGVVLQSECLRRCGAHSTTQNVQLADHGSFATWTELKEHNPQLYSPA